MLKKRIFITGSNTDIGKTFITNQLLKIMIKKGVSVIPFKPIETGCKKINHKLIPNDSSIYFKTLNKSITLEKINPYRFYNAISPTMAMILEKKNYFLKDYIKKISLLPKSEYILIEGAGGLFSPIAKDGLNIDFIKKAKLETIFVVKDELGAITNTLANLEALKYHKIKILGIVLNRKSKKILKEINNIKEIKRYTKIPVYQIVNGPYKKNQAVLIKLFKDIIAN